MYIPSMNDAELVRYLDSRNDLSLLERELSNRLGKLIDAKKDELDDLQSAVDVLDAENERLRRHLRRLERQIEDED